MSTVDSFKFLFDQIAKETSHLATDIRDVFAVIGAFYAAKKSYAIATNVIDAIYVHALSNMTSSDPREWVEKFGPWAVVTGSSEGIGRAYAYELACRGLNIVLISRNERKLKKAKAEIELLCDVQVEYIIADYSSESQTELYEHIEKELSGKEIGLLVNNVGIMYDYPDVLLNVQREKLWQLIHVNVGAATMMSHLVLPQMVARGKGGLVVVSSGSSTQITPQMTVYSATKRYLDYFIKGIAYEYRDSGITFQCLIPFYAATRMTGYSETLSKSGFLIPNATQFAKSAVKTLGRSSTTTGYFPHTLQLWLSRLIPLWLWMWAGEKLNNSLRREALNRLSRLGSKRSMKSTSGDHLSDLKK